VHTRRDFLQRAADLGVALPALPTLLAACADREAEDGVELAIGTPSNPAQQPLFEDNPAIESGLPDEEGPLQLYNWADYINQDVLMVVTVTAIALAGLAFRAWKKRSGGDESGLETLASLEM